jgi:hypothetical protein
MKGENAVASHVVDSALFQDLFGTAEMREVFSDESLVQAWLDAKPRWHEPKRG